MTADRARRHNRGGAESERRGARYPVTSDVAPSALPGPIRSPGARGASGVPAAGRGGARREAARHPGGAAGIRADTAAQLEAPVTVRGLAEHPRIAGRYRVRVSAAAGEAELLLGASGVGDFAVRAGRVFDDEQWRRVQREARIVAAQDAALRSLASGRRSERDLVQRVRRRERDAGVVADAIERLRVLGLVDDAAFADAEAAAKLRRGTVSTGQVRRDLRRRGVAAELADGAIAVASEEFEVDDAARCREAATKRARQLGALAPDVFRRRLGAWLMRRGFAPGVVAPVVRQLLAERGTGAPDDTIATDDDGEWPVGAADD